MTLNELQEIVFKRATKGGGWRIIERLLDEAGGSIPRALELLKDDDAFRLGHFGCYTGTYRLDCYGSAATTPISAWIGPDYWDRPPDLVVKWRDVFRHVAGIEQSRLL